MPKTNDEQEKKMLLITFLGDVLEKLCFRLFAANMNFDILIIFF